MKRKNTVILFTLFFAVFASYQLEKKKSRCSTLLFTNHYQPFIKGSLCQNKETFLLDSGGSFCCLVSKKTLDLFPHKQWIRDLNLMNFRGNIDSHPEYLIQEPNILDINFNNLLLSQLPENSLESGTGHGIYESCLEDHVQTSNDIITSHIGHKLLASINFLFDFKNKKFKTFNKGYLPLFSFPYGNIKKYNQIFFEYDKYRGLFCTILTQYGPKKFMIDTGTTLTILNSSSFSNIATKQISDEHLPEAILNTFQLGKINYSNKQAFVIDELKFDGFDGVLGMDFFYDKTLFFDMENHVIYLK
jgi:hypothetical protein